MQLGMKHGIHNEIFQNMGNTNRNATIIQWENILELHHLQTHQ